MSTEHLKLDAAPRAADAAAAIWNSYLHPPRHGSFPAPTKCGQLSGLGCPARGGFRSLNPKLLKDLTLKNAVRR
jgi:hypothetical protein